MRREIKILVIIVLANSPSIKQVVCFLRKSESYDLLISKKCPHDSD